MNELMVIEQYQGNNVEFRQADGYLNFTALCRAFGERSNDFMRLSSTVQLLNYVADELGRLPGDLVVVDLEAANGGCATWIHPQLAIAACRWVNNKFGMWCDRTLKKDPRRHHLSAGERVHPVLVPETTGEIIARSTRSTPLASVALPRRPACARHGRNNPKRRRRAREVHLLEEENGCAAAAGADRTSLQMHPGQVSRFQEVIATSQDRSDAKGE